MLSLANASDPRPGSCDPLPPDGRGNAKRAKKKSASLRKRTSKFAQELSFSIVLLASTASRWLVEDFFFFFFFLSTSTLTLPARFPQLRFASVSAAPSKYEHGDVRQAETTHTHTHTQARSSKRHATFGTTTRSRKRARPLGSAVPYAKPRRSARTHAHTAQEKRSRPQPRTQASWNTSRTSKKRGSSSLALTPNRPQRPYAAARVNVEDNSSQLVEAARRR